MKRLFSTKHLPLYTIIAGLIGCFLRLWLFRTGIDGRGLLIPDHPASVPIFILAGLYLCLLFFSVRNSKSQQPAPATLLSSVFSVIGSFAGAAGLLYMAMRSAQDSTAIVSRVVWIFGILAALALLYVPLSRLWKGKFADTALLVAVAFLLVQTIYLYKEMSTSAQVQGFLFPLVAALLLPLCVLYRSRVITHPAAYPAYVFFNQASVFFCFLCLNGEFLPFFLLMGLWAAGNLGCLAAPEEG